MSASAAQHAREQAPRRVWPWVAGALVAIVAVAVGIGAAVAGAHWSDERTEVLPPPVTSPTQQLPVLLPVEDGSTTSAIGGAYALEPFASSTSAALRSGWGVADAAAPTGGSAGEPELTDGAVSHAANCTRCPGADGVVLAGRRDPPANVVGIFPYPRPDQAAAAECGFADVDDDELPIAVVTGNPGRVELHVGADRYVVESTDDEVGEWEEWMDGPAGDRPAGSLVAHCISVPMPAQTAPIVLSVDATDATGTTASAVAALVPDVAGGLPVVVTPLDGTLLAVDVPVASPSATPSVTASAAAEGCETDAEPGPTVGWRAGSTSTAPVATTSGARPYLDGTAAVVRRVVALAEGTPSLVCVDRGGERVGILVTPPDARRLSLAATALDGPAGAVELEGTFATVDWTPCRGTAVPGVEVALCDSGGDTGAVAAAGGLLDLIVRAGGSEATARISLSTLPGGQDVDVYRLPVPGGGTVELTARWDEGPVGAGPEWLFAAGP